MTYFSFLIRFVIPPLILLVAFIWWQGRIGRIAHLPNRQLVLKAIILHVLLAVAYTTPWDNYLVANGVWYYHPELVSGVVIGYVPLEEYIFFVLETLLCGFWWWFLAQHMRSVTGQGSQSVPFVPRPRIRYLAAGLTAGLWAVFVLLLFGGNSSWTYLSLILVWGLPVLFVQFAFGADLLWYHRRLVFWAAFVPGMYLSLTDMIALRAGTWNISPSHTIGVQFFGILPLEEVTFFFVTATMIVFGVTLLVSEEAHQRFREWKASLRFSGCSEQRPS